MPATTSLILGLGLLTGLLVAAALVAAVIAVMWVLTRQLAARRRVFLVPADDFDVELEDVRRFGLQLARTRRRSLGWLDRRAGAIRLRMDASGEGAIVAGAELPGHADALIRHALYRDVALFDAARADELPALAHRTDTASEDDEDDDASA